MRTRARNEFKTDYNFWDVPLEDELPSLFRYPTADWMAAGDLIFWEWSFEREQAVFSRGVAGNGGRWQRKVGTEWRLTMDGKIDWNCVRVLTAE